MKVQQLIFVYKCGHQKVINMANPEEFEPDEHGVVDSRQEYCNECDSIYNKCWEGTFVPKWRFK